MSALLPTTADVHEAVSAGSDSHARPRRPRAIATLLRNPLGAFAAIVLVLVLIGAVLAPLLTPYNVTDADLRIAFSPPGGGHLLGTDSAGRDVWTRLLYGARNTLGGAALALAVAMVLGITAGLIAGYFGRAFDSASNWVVDLLMALPPMLVLLASRAVLGPTVWALMIILGVLAAPSFYRLVRGVVVNVRGELFVDAARVSGLSSARIIGRHVVVVVRAPIIIQISLVAGVALGLQAGLEFIGVGSSASIPTWGSMLNEGFQNIYRAPLLMLWPALALGLASAAFVLLAVALRDALEEQTAAPRTRRRAASVSPTAAAQADADAAPRAGLLSVRGLSVAYATPAGDREVVHSVDLDVAAGEIVGLVGESGSGKSQTAFSVLGIVPEGGRVSGGSILLDGREVTTLRDKGWRDLRGTVVAYVPQEPMSNLDPVFTIGAQLVEPLLFTRGLSKRAARARALELLRAVEIADPERVFRSYPHEISGGMAQRVLIAGAMASDPKLLIADEPTTALDVTVQAEILELLRRLQKERGLGVLLVTHNFGVVADLCDRVAVMEGGRIVETGSVDDVLLRPREPYTRRLLAAMLDDVPTPPTLEKADRAPALRKELV
jgi:ABC-type dipeptide/oligopeptide/nickel transport system ATPase component/ABC-type dipeptide/oligopeptide/nickel transport system permease subunit